MSWKRLFLIAFILWGAWHTWSTRTVTHPHGVLVSEEPSQSPITAAAITHGDFTMTPRARFEITARVLARERYRSGREADLSPVDLALGWGPMSDTAVLEKIHVTQGSRFYFWRTEQPPIPLQDIARHSANMHMIPANNRIRSQLLGIRKGSVIRLSAQLVDIDSRNGWRWRTSLSRDDTGAGACEILLVEEVSILQ